MQRDRRGLVAAGRRVVARRVRAHVGHGAVGVDLVVDLVRVRVRVCGVVVVGGVLVVRGDAFGVVVTGGAVV